MAKIIEKIKFHYNMIFLNRRNTLVMFLGLGISLALIASSLMFMYSYQYGGFTGFYQEVPPKQFTISVSSFDITNEIGAGVPKLIEISDSAIKAVELEERVDRVDWFLSRGLFSVVNFLDGNDSTYINEFSIYAIPPDYFSTIEEILYNGTIPQQIDDIIVVADTATIENTNISLMDTIPLYTPMFMMSSEQVIATGMPYGGNYLNISGIISTEAFNSVRGPMADDFAAMAEYFSDQFMITSYTNFANFVTNIGYLAGMSTPTGRLTFDLEKIDSFDLNMEIAKITQLAQEVTREFEEEGYSLHVYNDLSLLLEDFRREFLVFQLFGILFLTPIIGMALSLTNYSANLMKRRQKRHVSSMLQRGSSRKEVMFNLILQVVEMTVSAILIAFVLGYLFSWLLTKSTGFLEFSGGAINPALNLIIFFVVITAGFILAIIINALNIWKMSTITTQEAYSEHQHKASFWERAFLDFFILIVGIALWIVVALQLNEASAYSFANGLGTTAIVCVILGGVLVISRTYPVIVEYLSNLSWKTKNFEIVGLAFKRSSRRKADTARSLILITLTFTLIFSSIVTIESYQDYDQENAYYAIGSDILIHGVNVGNDIAKEQISAIEGVQSATYLRMTTQVLSYGGLVYSYQVIGIDPEGFASTAYFDKEYLPGNDPMEFFGRIVDDNDVVMQKDQLRHIGAQEGETFEIVYQKYAQGVLNRTLDIQGEYNYMPRFYKKPPEEDQSVYRFVIIGTFDNVDLFTYSQFSSEGDLLVKVDPNYSIKDVASTIEEEIGRTVLNVDDLRSTFDGSLRNTMLYGSLNSSFISSIIITISAITLMILIQAIEKEREVVTLKVLGMSPKQLFGMFLTESMTLVVFGAITGAALGSLAAYMFTEILTYSTNIPENELIFKPLQLLLATGILFGTSIISAALTSWIIFRKDTIKAIKQI